MILRFSNFHHKAVTLLELILAAVLMSMIVIGFAGIDLFSRHNVLAADRLAKVQDSLSYAMAHMTKNIGMAIGDINNPPITRPSFALAETAIQIRIDYNWTDGSSNGRLDLDTDAQIAYTHNATYHELRYYPNILAPATYEVLSNLTISNLDTSNASWSSGDNYMQIKLSGRYNPAQSAAPTNPQVNLTADAKMPYVSTH